MCLVCTMFIIIDIVLGPPDPLTDLSYDNNTVIIESSVDLQWNRPSYTGGAPIVNYIVSINDMNDIMDTSNEMITLTLPENINDDIHLLVVAINLCGIESEASQTITVPAEGKTIEGDCEPLSLFNSLIIRAK